MVSWVFPASCQLHGLVWGLRNIMFILIPVALTDDPVPGVLSATSVLVVTGLLQCWVRPWRTETANMADALASVGIIFVSSAASGLVTAKSVETASEATFKHPNNVVLAGTASTVSVLALMALYLALKNLRR